VPGFISAFDALLGFLRVAFFALAAMLAVIAALDWAVRTRRLNPFGPLARFFRQTVDPVFAPVERQLVRAGGTPTAAPWWALAAAVLAGIVILSLLSFIRSQLLGAMFAVETGPIGLYRLLVAWIFGILQVALILRVISSWIRISPYSKWVRWSFTLTEPLLRPLRSIIPPIGTIDITPIVAFFVLRLLQAFLLSLG
jgi:YggT family protein